MRWRPTPGIEVVREEARSSPTGPGRRDRPPHLRRALGLDPGGAGGRGLAFFDAIAPIVHRDSLDESVVFAGRAASGRTPTT
jgi:methylenetetrahydrofolate--tRNA-(uracil-5-)-methyltransferase